MDLSHQGCISRPLTLVHGQCVAEDIPVHIGSEALRNLLCAACIGMAPAEENLLLGNEAMGVCTGGGLSDNGGLFPGVVTINLFAAGFVFAADR